MSLQGKELELLKERSRRNVSVASELLKSIEALKRAPEGGSDCLDLDVLLTSLQELQQNSELCAKLADGASISSLPKNLPLPQLPPIEVRVTLCCYGWQVQQTMPLAGLAHSAHQSETLHSQQAASWRFAETAFKCKICRTAHGLCPGCVLSWLLF